MKRTLVCLALLFPVLAHADKFHCTVDESAKIIFKMGATSETPDIQGLIDNDYMVSMIDMSTVKTSGRNKSVWIWNVHKVFDKDVKISKLKVAFDAEDPEVFSPLATVSYDCSGKTVDNKVYSNPNWLIMGVNSPAYVARLKLYGKESKE